MNRRKSIILVVSSMLLTMAGMVSAAPGAPNFMPAVYGDGEVWGTKATTQLPAPNGKNAQSFDDIYVFTNANNPNGVQLPKRRPGIRTTTVAAGPYSSLPGRQRASWPTAAMRRY